MRGKSSSSTSKLQAERLTRLRERGLGRFLWDAAYWRMRFAVQDPLRATGCVLRTVDRTVQNAGRRAMARLERAASAGGVARIAYRMAQPVVRTLVGVRRAIVHAILRTLRLARQLCLRLLLTSHRHNAAIFWPGVRGLELWLIATWLALLRYHDQMLWLVCTRAHLLRRLRTPRPGRNNHVLHVTASFDLGGTQTQIKNLCENAAAGKLSHEVTEIFPEQNYLYRCEERIEPERYQGKGTLARAAAKLIAYSGTRSSQIVQVWKLVKDMQASRPSIVVGWGHELSMLTFVAAAIARVPQVVFCIRTFNPGFGWVTPSTGELMHAAHSRMLPYLSGIIVNSTVLQRDYAQWMGIDVGRITVCANGIDPIRVTPQEAAERRRLVRERYAIADDALLLIHVGRFSPEKGQMSLMAANLELLRRYPRRNFVWLLCGDGPTMQEVRQFAAENGFTNVVFAGRVNPVRDCLIASDICVMPSDFEGMPNALMEAMAQGLAAVSTDRSGVIDVARHGIEALYYPPRDVAQLVAHLSYLFENDAERCAMGLRAQQRMREFSIARAVETFNRSLLAFNDTNEAERLAGVRAFRNA